MELYWFAHTSAFIVISDDGKTATLIKMAATPLSTSPVVPEQKTYEGIQKLAIHIEECGDIDLCVAFVVSDKLSELNLDNYIFTKIKDW